MFLERLDIVNFRGIRELSLDFAPTTVLIGENNTGKSTILAALQTCLSRSLNRRAGVFTEYDYHLPDKDTQPVDSDAIEIRLRFAENDANEWPDEVTQILGEAVQVDDCDRQVVLLRVRSVYVDARDDFETEWSFLNLDGDDLVSVRAGSFINSLQQLTPVFYLAALRDAAQEFRSRSQFWRPFVRSMKIEEDARQQIENDLAAINQTVLDSNESFRTVEEQLSRTGQMVPLDGDSPVGIEAIPTKVFDILSRTQVMLGSVTGARLPIGRHGEGTQSLAVICLFDAFLQSQLEDSYTEFTSPILALEEPEAHLHPSAIHSVSELLEEIEGQKIVSTHSGDLVASVPLTSLRRLRRQEGKITVQQIQQGTLTDDELRKLNHHIRSTRGSLLFARVWLLVEGETDRLIFEGAARVLGRNLMSDGVGIVEYQHIGIGTETLAKFADQLGIEWVLVADKDHAGAGYIRGGTRQLNGRPAARHLHMLDHGNMEVFLCMEGYGDIYKATVSPQKSNMLTEPEGTLEYWKQVADNQRDNSKPRNAVTVVEQMESGGEEAVPDQLRQIIDTALRLSEESRNG